MNWNRLLVLGSFCFAAALGCGQTAAGKHTKLVDQRVAELEAKVERLEHQLKVVEAELARTPRLGLQSAR